MAVAQEIEAGQVGLGWLWLFRGQVPSYRVVCCPVGPDLSGKAVAWARGLVLDFAQRNGFTQGEKPG